MNTLIFPTCFSFDRGINSLSLKQYNVRELMLKFLNMYFFIIMRCKTSLHMDAKLIRLQQHGNIFILHRNHGGGGGVEEKRRKKKISS